MSDMIDQTQSISVNQLRAFIERIERLEEEKKQFLMTLETFTLNLKDRVLMVKLCAISYGYAKKKTMNGSKKKLSFSSIKMRLA